MRKLCSESKNGIETQTITNPGWNSSFENGLSEKFIENLTKLKILQNSG